MRNLLFIFLKVYKIQEYSMFQFLFGLLQKQKDHELNYQHVFLQQNEKLLSKKGIFTYYIIYIIKIIDIYLIKFIIFKGFKD